MARTRVKIEDTFKPVPLNIEKTGCEALDYENFLPVYNTRRKTNDVRVGYRDGAVRGSVYQWCAEFH
jgi:hypothetical protein